jgi:uncharacterized protein YodC (DUF2158 family)
MEQLQVGDIVQLKSGGPKMTIEKISNYASGQVMARCAWFIQDNQKAEVFALTSLQKA